jgi:energy-coupling factor transport system ATP-binding protein
MSAVVVQQLGYRFAGSESLAVEGISFELEKASWTLVAGRTGSGKTTLLRALCGLIPHHASGEMQGTVKLLERDTRRQTTAQLAELVGLVLQSPDDQLCTTTPAAEIAFGLENLCQPPEVIKRRIDEVLSAARLTDITMLRNHQLSGGQKQRLVLASIMAARPRVLILDEPLSQLDQVAAQELLDCLDRLRREGVTIVMVEHRLDDVLPLVDRVLLLDEGKLVANLAASDTERLAAEFTDVGLELPEVTQLAWQLQWHGVRSLDQFVTRIEATRQPSPDAPRSCPIRAATPSGEVLMEIRGLCLRFASQQKPLWQELSFSLHARQRIALVGPNGAGKSSLLGVLAGLIKPTSGQMAWVAASGREASARHPAVGLLLQNPDLMLFCNTVEQELAFGPRQFGLRPAELAERVDAAARQMSIKVLLDQPPLGLSQGQRLRTALAATLSLETPLLLLDEPTTGQDPRQVSQLMEAISAEFTSEHSHRCLMFSTHDLRMAMRFADRVLVLAEGRLLADCPPEQLMSDDALLAAAGLHRPPLWQLRHRHRLCGRTVAELAEELRR